MTTTTAGLEQQILDVLVSEYEAPADTTGQTSFDLLGFDSLVLVELGVALTKRYGVEIGDEELREAGNAARTAELLLSKGITV
ncbi:acyl carrier protein [Streptomyces sp. WELS2]|uniref:acyl carrier protein n=1 Tax=Streptomyces sp. WELS2 TaxID=2749435 RepID=UPI0015F0ADA7|nr:acyl carrier protein [Streptomyces sp. WELS2]